MTFVHLLGVGRVAADRVRGDRALLFVSTQSFAELRGGVIFEDTFYGAVTGSVIGGAFMVFTDRPRDHWNCVGCGAAAGAIPGAVFSVCESTALAEVRDGS